MWSPPEPTPHQRRALEALRAARRPLLVGHERPDADVLGSQAALARGLAALGAEPTVLNADAPPRGYEWIEPPGGYRHDRGGRLPSHDLVVLLDLSEVARTGALATRLAASQAPRLVIDHHRLPADERHDLAFHDERAAATGVLVARILVDLGAPLCSATARAIALAVVSDTGSFRHDTTDAEALAVASLCVAHGADLGEIHRRTAQQRDPRFPQALGLLLARTRYLHGGRTALVDEPRSLGLGGVEGLSGALLDVLRSVGDVDVALHLREGADGVCRLSARSKPPAEVHGLAVRLGGGGHARAAGATLSGPLAAALERLEHELSSAALRPDAPVSCATR
jgi:phosphoesterase RecJ-like protein